MTHSRSKDVESTQSISRSRLSVLHLAASALLDDLHIDDEGNFFLNICGRKVRSNLPDVMRAANTVLAREGRPQIAHNPCWIVSVPNLSTTTTEEKAHV